MSALRPFLAAALISAPFSQAQVAGPLDFEVSGQLSGNFRPTLNGGTASEANDGTNGYVQVLGGTGTTPWIGIYDTTPTNATDAAQTFSGPITVHIEISGANTSSSFGVFLFDPANSANNLLANFNLDTAAGGTGNEQFRFWKDRSTTTSAVSNPFTTAAFTGTNGTFDGATNSWVTTAANRGNLAIDFTSPFTFYALDFIYDPAALTLEARTGDFSATLNIPAGDVILNPALAVRINDSVVDAANTAKFDNFAVIPEPASAAMFGLGLVSLAMFRRRSNS